MIEIQNDAAYPVDTAALEQAIKTTLQQQGQPDANVTLVITTDQAITDLNRQFRGIDLPTDILSFPAEMPDYLGDLVLAYPYAAAQAEHEGHALGDSLALLVVHGTLHLLGYDHDTTENRAAMWAAQAQALTALGIAPEIAPDEA